MKASALVDLHKPSVAIKVEVGPYLREKYAIMWLKSLSWKVNTFKDQMQLLEYLISFTHSKMKIL